MAAIPRPIADLPPPADPVDATPSRAERSLGFMFSDILRLIRKDFYDRAGGMRLTPALWRLIFHLDLSEGCRQAQMAATLDVTAVTLGRMVDRLEKLGLVRRAPDLKDRRATRLFLTPDAAGLLSRMHELAEDTRVRALQGMSSAEQRALLQALMRIRTNLSRPESEDGR